MIGWIHRECNNALDVQKAFEETNRKKQLWEKRRMVNFMKAIETLKRWIGLDKRSGEDRRKKKPRKRKYEKRLAGKSSDRRK